VTPEKAGGRRCGGRHDVTCGDAWPPLPAKTLPLGTSLRLPANRMVYKHSPPKGWECISAPATTGEVPAGLPNRHGGSEYQPFIGCLNNLSSSEPMVGRHGKVCKLGDSPNFRRLPSVCATADSGVVSAMRIDLLPVNCHVISLLRMFTVIPSKINQIHCRSDSQKRC
jgi:hypothetical protein